MQARCGFSNPELRVCVCGNGVVRAFSFSLRDTVWFGRDASCQIVLPSQEVSRRHASLFVNGDAVFVRDHSSYGTRVNGQPVQLAVRRVRVPALLQLGPYSVEISLLGAGLGRQLSARLARAWARLAPTRYLVAFVLVLGTSLWLSAGRSEPQPASLASAGPRHAAEHVDGCMQMVSARSVVRAVELLRAGDRRAAMHAYRTLAARDEGRAELAIVAELLARELRCAP